LGPEQAERLDRYCELLWDWNTRLNLTRHTDYETFVARDVTDALALASLLEPNETVLDVGAGGGAMGVILKIMRADLDITMCESVQKKAEALADIVRRLDIAARVEHARAEALLAKERFSTVVARAVGPLAKLLTWFGPHWNALGRLLLVKGPRWVEERGEARHRGLLHGLELRRALQYNTPGSGAENVILAVWSEANATSKSNQGEARSEAESSAPPASDSNDQ